MKNIFYSFLLILAVGLTTSCDDKNFLDETQTTDLDYEVVFSDSVYTVAYLQEIYRAVAFDVYPARFIVKRGFVETTYGGLQGACDEAEVKQSADITTDLQFATGTVNPITADTYTWKTVYENIRRVNVFFANVDKAPISAPRRKVYKAEARFLRAMYYFILVRHYGGIPLIGDVVYSGPEDDIKTTRDSFKDCVDYIVSECDLAAQDLQIIKPRGRDYGRVGRGACMALKARILLYAASPLFNGGNYAPDNYPKELVGYTDYDKERWKKAMDAAEAIISTQQYKVFAKQVDGDNHAERGFGFYATFVAADFYKEGAEDAIILELQKIKNTDLHKLYTPPTCGGNQKAGYPYQGLIDAFPMADGSKFDWNNPEHSKNPYANRDPRMDNTIVRDGVVMKSGDDDDHVISTYLGVGQTPDAVKDGTPTGYYFRKGCHRATAANHWIMTPGPFPVFRYSEVLLNYAEARNEYSGPSDEVYQALTAIREVAGIQPGVELPGVGFLYGLKANMTQDEMREAIQNERRVELAVEGHRFFDVRRWKIADKTENKKMTGMEIRLEGAEKTYKVFDVRSHVFSNAMYLFPIPNKEAAKSPDLIQNPYY